jgi:hypothetical protein
MLNRKALAEVDRVKLSVFVGWCPELSDNAVIVPLYPHNVVQSQPSLTGTSE